MAASQWEKFIAISCTHGDLFDPKVKPVLQSFIADWKPHHRIHLGDLFDLRALRRNVSPDERQEGIAYDYSCGIELLDWFKPHYLTLGNHDHRIWRAADELATHGVLAEAMRKLAEDTEESFRKRKIKWVHYAVDQHIKLPCGGPLFLHGYRSTMYPAKSHFENWGDCVLGHVHKPDHYEARHINGGKAFTVGTLADISKMRYADATPAKLGWRQSFIYGMINKRTGKWHGWQVINEGGEWISPHGIL